ncbi:hypothetical protein Tco_0918542 [Tanacetum coccineum]
MGKKKVDTDVHKEKKKDGVPSKKRSLTAADNILPDPDEAVKLAKSIREVNLEADKGVDDNQRKKLKGVAFVPVVAQSLLNLKKGSKASREEYILQQILKGPDDSEKGADEKAKDEKVKDDKAEDENDDEVKDADEKADDNKARDEHARVLVPEPQNEKPKVTPLSPSCTLSSIEYGNQFLNDSSDISLVAIEESVQANVINEVKNQLSKFLPKVVSDFVKPRMERTARDDKKKRRRKDTDPSKKNNDQSGSSKKGTTPSKSLKSDKTVNAEESVQDAAINIEESIKEYVVNAQDPTKADVAPNQYNSKWFKQGIIEIPETPDPDWHKELNANDAREQNLFNEFVNAEKDPKQFDDLMGSTIDLTKFAKNCLKKDKITKADLEGPAFALLNGNYKINIERGYNLEHSSKVGYDLNVALGIHHWGPKRQVFYRATHARTSPHKVYSRMKILSVIRISVDKQFGYGYLKEIVVRGANQIVLKKRVEDIQLVVESYQIKLSITMPQITCAGIEIKEPYTILYKPRGVVYLNKSNHKFLMRDDELYKFSDRTLKSIRDTLDLMLHNFVLGYHNKDMPNRSWSEKDQK